VDSEHGKLREKTIVEEMEALHKNKAWDLVDLFTGRNPIGIKYGFKNKFNAERKVKKHKA
jgi:hypothetical protein